jgi:hypothetical protein
MVSNKQTINHAPAGILFFVYRIAPFSYADFGSETYNRMQGDKPYGKV